MLQRLVGARVDFLDQMRAIAIAAVLIVHFHSDWLPAGGAVGVGIFFSLSGFLIATILLDEDRFDARSAARFIIRRFMRIYPAYLVAVLTTVGLTYLYKPENWDAVIAAVPGILTFTLIPHSLGGAYSALWTLQIEMAFYLVMPIFMLMLGRPWGIMVASALMIALSISVFFGFPSVSPIQIYSGHLAVGALLSAAWKFGLLARLHINPMVLAILSVAGIVALLCLPAFSGLRWTLVILLASLCGCGLIGAFLLAPSLSVLPGTQWIGRISYSVYLVHGIVLDFRFVPNLIFNPFYALYSSQGFARTGTFFVTVISIAAISYYWIEKPGIRIGKRWASAISRSP